MVFCVQAGWDDVPHLTAEQKKKLLESFPPHERKARSQGVPMLGSGQIFPIDEGVIKTPAIAIPKHWRQIVGVDFGVDHPFAATRVAHDMDSDCVYVTHCARMKGEHVEGVWTGSPAYHAPMIKAWGSWIPCAWPHDGLEQDRQSGERLADIYTSHGLNMLPERATHEDGGNGVEAGLADMLERMQTGRFKVFDGLNEWFEEFRMYHRKDGKIVKLRDDLMASTRYAIMMLRHAIVQPNNNGKPHRQKVGWRAGAASY